MIHRNLSNERADIDLPLAILDIADIFLADDFPASVLYTERQTASRIDKFGVTPTRLIG